MPSLISQMRNGPMPQQQAPAQLPIQQVKDLMQQFKNSSDPQQLLMSMIQQDPRLTQISQMLQGGNNMESLARQMAQERGIDIDNLVQQLIGG